MLGRESVAQQPGVNLDDRLRSVPGFTLFRRSSSLVANPTTQGVSLRGLGSSGASRTLVLWDGIPINDPFGGWVYWTRVAPEQVERVEVSRGASTSIFGDRAMSGTIAMFSRAPEARRFSLGYEGGNLDTHVASAAGSHVFGSFAVSAAARALTTDGYYIVPERTRGAIDRRANVRAAAGDARLDWLGPDHRLFLKFDALTEERDNGTSLTHNSTSLGNIAAHYARHWRSDDLSVLAYHTREEYRASFSSISADRATERLTFNQTVPSEAVGAAALWRHSTARWKIIGGADMQRVEGYSTDSLFPSGIRVGGGSQLQHGAFAQADVTVGAMKAFVGGRHQFTGQNSKLFSPSSGLVFGRGLLRARGTVYGSFRAPTLNELFREFRVGNVRTIPNAELRAESTFGAEAGVDLVGEGTSAAVTLFRHELDNLITNVTIGTQAGTILRQRRNAQAALARGFDVELRHRWRRLRAEASYLFADSRFSTGERIPQVPRHQGNAQLSYSHRGTLVSAGFRSFAAQFEDDLNRFLLPGFATLQFVARQSLRGPLSASLVLENALNREFLVGFSPTPLIGQPRLWRAGLRWN